MKTKGAGDRRHRITLESPSITQNAANGEKTIGWQFEGEVWASIEPVAGNGRETLIAKSFTATTSHRIDMLYRPDINSTWRIRYQGRIFGIDGATTPDEVKKDLLLYCTEVAKRGPSCP